MTDTPRPEQQPAETPDPTIGPAVPDRPDPDDIVASAWGDWVHDRLLGDPIGVAAQPAIPLLHTRFVTVADISDGSARLTVTFPTPFPTGLLAAWATPIVQGAESRLYSWDYAASTKDHAVFMCYALREVSGAPVIAYSAGTGQYPSVFAIGS